MKELSTAVVIIVLSFVFGPLLALWSLNTISEQASMGWYIPHNFWTYLATWLLGAVIVRGRSS